MTYVIRRAPIALAAVLLVAACSSTPDAPTQAAPTFPTSPSCSELFQPGKPIDAKKASTGCTDGSGGSQVVASFTCNDGTHLWQVDARTGAPAGYGQDGKAYKAVRGEIAADAGYKKAYASCVS